MYVRIYIHARVVSIRGIWRYSTAPMKVALFSIHVWPRANMEGDVYLNQLSYHVVNKGVHRLFIATYMRDLIVLRAAQLALPSLDNPLSVTFLFPTHSATSVAAFS